MKNEWNIYWKNKNTNVSWLKRRMIRIVNKYIKKNMKVLDAGCGSGFFSKYFVDKDCNVFALDYSRKALEMTKKLDKRIITKRGDASNLKFNNNSFDLVFSDGLLEHYKKPEKILKEFNRVLKPSGIIITFVPNKVSYWIFLKPFKMRNIKEYRFGLKRLINLHKNLGLNILNYGGISVFPTKFSPEFLGKYIGRIIFVIAKKGG